MVSHFFSFSSVQEQKTKDDLEGAFHMTFLCGLFNKTMLFNKRMLFNLLLCLFFRFRTNESPVNH